MFVTGFTATPKGNVPAATVATAVCEATRIGQPIRSNQTHTPSAQVRSDRRPRGCLCGPRSRQARQNGLALENGRMRELPMTADDDVSVLRTWPGPLLLVFVFETTFERKADKYGPRCPVRIYLWLAFAGGPNGSRENHACRFSFWSRLC